MVFKYLVPPYYGDSHHRNKKYNDRQEIFHCNVKYPLMNIQDGQQNPHLDKFRIALTKLLGDFSSSTIATTTSAKITANSPNLLSFSDESPTNLLPTEGTDDLCDFLDCFIFADKVEDDTAILMASPEREGKGNISSPLEVSASPMADLKTFGNSTKHQSRSSLSRRFQNVIADGVEGLRKLATHHYQHQSRQTHHQSQHHNHHQNQAQAQSPHRKKKRENRGMDHVQNLRETLRAAMVMTTSSSSPRASGTASFDTASIITNSSNRDSFIDFYLDCDDESK